MNPSIIQSNFEKFAAASVAPTPALKFKALPTAQLYKPKFEVTEDAYKNFQSNPNNGSIINNFKSELDTMSNFQNRMNYYERPTTKFTVDPNTGKELGSNWLTKTVRATGDILADTGADIVKIEGLGTGVYNLFTLQNLKNQIKQHPELASYAVKNYPNIFGQAVPGLNIDPDAVVDRLGDVISNGFTVGAKGAGHTAAAFLGAPILRLGGGLIAKTGLKTLATNAPKWMQTAGGYGKNLAAYQINPLYQFKPGMKRYMLGEAALRGNMSNVINGGSTPITPKLSNNPSIAKSQISDFKQQNAISYNPNLAKYFQF